MTHEDAEALAAAIHELIVAQIDHAMNPAAANAPSQVRIAYTDLVLTLERLQPPEVR
jgi:hypothetical protein